MGRTPRKVIAKQLDAGRAAGLQAWDVVRQQGLGQVQFWFIALAIGIGAGVAALGFRMGISALQSFIF